MKILWTNQNLIEHPSCHPHRFCHSLQPFNKTNASLQPLSGAISMATSCTPGHKVSECSPNFMQGHSDAWLNRTSMFKIKKGKKAKRKKSML